MKTNVFLQSELLADVEVIEIDSTTGLEALLEVCRSKAGAPHGEHFFLLIEDDDDDLAVSKLKAIPEGLRLHLHRHKGIDVIVKYSGRDVRRTFRPSATITRIKRWATHELGIAPSDALELMMQIHGTEQRPDGDVHVGSLVKHPAHDITFDLVPSPRVNG
jgi:hypothetical protein